MMTEIEMKIKQVYYPTIFDTEIIMDSNSSFEILPVLVVTINICGRIQYYIN